MISIDRFSQQKRLHREARTIDAMIYLHCKKQHHCDGLCKTCQELQQFCYLRLSRCPYAEDKPTCQTCDIHCYRGAKDLRQEVRNVMRQVGPRMIWHHPVMAIQHLADKRRRVPAKKKNLKEGFRSTVKFLGV